MRKARTAKLGRKTRKRQDRKSTHGAGVPRLGLRCAALVKLREGECAWRRCRSEVKAGEMFCERHRDMADGVVLGWFVEKKERELKSSAGE